LYDAKFVDLNMTNRR